MGVAAPQICGSELVTASLVKLSREEVYQVGWCGMAALDVQELALVGLLV